MAEDPNIARSLGRTRKASRAVKVGRVGSLPPGLRKKQLGLRDASSIAPGRTSGGPFGPGQGGGLPTKRPAPTGGMKQASPNPGRPPAAPATPTGMKQASPNFGRTPRATPMPRPSGGRVATTGKTAGRVNATRPADTTRSDLSFKPVGPVKTASSGSARRILPRPPVSRQLGRR